MTKRELFTRHYDVGPEMVLDFLQQAMAGLPTVSSFHLAESGDRIEFTTTHTLTSWGDDMEALVDRHGEDGSALIVSGKPRVGMLSTPWGEEIHAATIEAQLFAAVDPIIEMARTNPIVMLQADHRRVEALFMRIMASDGDVRSDLVEQLLQALRVHMELEERHVYPIVQDQVDAELAEEAEVEHQLARDGLAQLAELSPEEPGFDAALAMVVAGIEHHVLEEETEAFPRLAAALGPDGLLELAQQLRETRAALLASTEPANGSRGGDDDAEGARPARPKKPRDPAQARRSRRDGKKIDPDETTKANLVEQAKRSGVSGYSHMTKAELAKALNAATR